MREACVQNALALHRACNDPKKAARNTPAKSVSATLSLVECETEIYGPVRTNSYPPHRVFAETIAGPLGLELAYAAYGSHQIAASNMMRAIKAVSTERGRDPRDYALFAYRAGPEEPVELVTIQVVGQGVPERPRVPEKLRTALPVETRRAPTRQAYFGARIGWLDAPVIQRADLTTAHRGPCIIEEYDATCVVPPDVTAVLDAYGNIVLDLP